MRLGEHLDADDRLSVRGAALPRGVLAGGAGAPVRHAAARRLAGAPAAQSPRVRAAFGEAWSDGPVQVLPSLKANFSLALRRLLTLEGLGCDTFGAGELQAALACGVPPELISVNGSSKSPRAHATGDPGRRAPYARQPARGAARGGSLPRNCETAATVRLRLRPDYSSLTARSEFAAEPLAIADVTARYKPGMPREELSEAARLLRGVPLGDGRRLSRPRRAPPARPRHVGGRHPLLRARDRGLRRGHGRRVASPSHRRRRRLLAAPRSCRPEPQRTRPPVASRDAYPRWPTTRAASPRSCGASSGTPACRRAASRCRSSRGGACTPTPACI